MTRQEYPRPQFVRDEWINLNGTWQFQFDDENIGEKEQYFNKETLDKEIQVPFVYQSELSGIGERTIHEYVWYKREAVIPQDPTKRTILHFGAVDYYSKVYVNGQFVGDHEGGHTSFSFDITNYLAEEKQSIAVKVYDPLKDETIPRGKQFWEEEPRAIWYTNSTGIWQTVWVEQVNKEHIDKVRFTSDFDRGVVWMDLSLNEETEISKASYYVNYKMMFKDTLIAEDRIRMNNI
ncbi:MAG: sugar-binding domain-containing protein, partial [Niallia sp.]